MSRRQRKSNGPGRSKVSGLFWILITAITIGAIAGSYLGRHTTTPNMAHYASESHSTDHSGTYRHPSIDADKQRHAVATKEDKNAVEVSPTTETQPNAEQKPEQGNSPKAGGLPEPKLGMNIIKPRHNGYPSEISHVDRADNKIALTFDAGASPVPTPSILRTLKAAGLHVTFFLTGKWCEQNPDLVREINQEGHEIGNHTYSHPDLRKLTDNHICDQLKKLDDIVTRLTGNSTKPFFRPPFGGRNTEVLRTASEQGYTSVYWSVDSWDAFKKGITSKEIEDRVLERVQSGDIVLMHCGSQPTATALPDLIRELQSRGYEIVTVSELVKG